MKFLIGVFVFVGLIGKAGAVDGHWYHAGPLLNNDVSVLLDFQVESETLGGGLPPTLPVPRSYKTEASPVWINVSRAKLSGYLVEESRRVGADLTLRSHSGESALDIAKANARKFPEFERVVTAINEALRPTQKSSTETIVSQFFSNYQYLGQNPSLFRKKQGEILDDRVVVYNRNFNNEKLYAGKGGYAKSVEDWFGIFTPGENFRYEVIENTGNEVTVLIRADLDVRRIGAIKRYAENEHFWIERFKFNERGKISRLDVYMNLGRDGSHAFDRFDMNVAMRAGARGDLDTVKRFESLGIDLSTTNPNNASLLYFAAQSPKNSVPIFEYVRERLGDSEFQKLLKKIVRSNGHSLALEAVFNTNADLIKYLVGLQKNGLDVDFGSPTVFGWTPKTFAVREKMAIADLLPDGKVKAEGRIEWMRQQEEEWLVSLDPAARDHHQKGMELISAIEQYDIAKIEELVSSGVEVNQRYGRLEATPLNSSVRPGMSPPDIAKAKTVQTKLLELGANPNFSEGGIMMVPSGFRETVFGYSELIQYMLAQFKPGSIEIEQYLNFQGPINGYTKLVDAALRGRADVIRVLVAAGADKKIQGHNGLTAIEAAKLYNGQSSTPLSNEIIEMLQP